MDHDKTGIISIAEIREIIKKQDEKMSHSELKHLVDELDHYGNVQINYIEFLATSINMKTFLIDSKLKTVFYIFDKD